MAYLAEDQVHTLSAATRCWELPEAKYLAESFMLQPGEQAIIPVKWTNPLRKDFACQVHQDAPVGIEALEGICEGGLADQMLCLYNGSPEPVMVDKGDKMAEGFAIPERPLIRRAPHPMTQEPPEMLFASRESTLTWGPPIGAGPDLVIKSPVIPEDGKVSVPAGLAGFGVVGDGSTGEHPGAAEANEGEDSICRGADAPVPCGTGWGDGSLGVARAAAAPDGIGDGGAVRTVAAEADSRPPLLGYKEAIRAMPELTLVTGLQDERFYHLVQDESSISHIHEEELPPDEYYEALQHKLEQMFPKATKSLVTHVVALVAAFDTGTAFSLSFGIEKF